MHLQQMQMQQQQQQVINPHRPYIPYLCSPIIYSLCSLSQPFYSSPLCLTSLFPHLPSPLVPVEAGKWSRQLLRKINLIHHLPIDVHHPVNAFYNFVNKHIFFSFNPSIPPFISSANSVVLISRQSSMPCVSYRRPTITTTTSNNNRRWLLPNSNA